MLKLKCAKHASHFRNIPIEKWNKTFLQGKYFELAIQSMIEFDRVKYIRKNNSFVQLCIITSILYNVTQ